jgi:hypothetical protein
MFMSPCYIASSMMKVSERAVSRGDRRVLEDSDDLGCILENVISYFSKCFSCIFRILHCILFCARTKHLFFV